MTGTKMNPFVGPRPFAMAERNLFFGRRRESADLLTLVMRKRLVLFYAASGVGKTSLINTVLLPELTRRGFRTCSVVRVGGDLPAGMAMQDVKNIFIFNLILNLDDNRHPAGQFQQMTMAEYIERYGPEATETESEQGKPYLLVVDQFEELFTSHPECWQQRPAFFEQLHEAMEQFPLLWVVLTMRAEYIAGLDRFAPLVPGQLSTRFYMQGLDHDAAVAAIEKPARVAERPFEAGVATKLVENLCLVRVRDHGAELQPGEFVEPVQLQVVCQQLWEALKTDPHEQIRLSDVERVAGEQGLARFVDNALGRFYDSVVAETARESGIAELELRTWCEEQLITGLDTRGLVLRGEEKSAGLPNRAVHLLEHKLLIHRADVSSGGVWYELIHDRFVRPIQTSNLNWYRRQPPVLQEARRWKDTDENPAILLSDSNLQEAVDNNWRTLSPLVAEFIDASLAAQAEQQRREHEAEQARELEHSRALAAVERERANIEARSRRHVQYLSIAILVALLAALSGWGFAAKNLREANVQITRRLITDSKNESEVQPQLRLLLAAEAVERAEKMDARLITEAVKNLRSLVIRTPGYPLHTTDDSLFRFQERAQLAASRDGTWLAAAAQDRTVYLWDLSTSVQAARAAFPSNAEEGYVTSLALSADNHWLAIARADGTLELVDLTASDLQASRALPNTGGQALNVMAFCPRSHRLVAGDPSGAITLFDLNQSRVVARPLASLPHSVVHIAFSPDEQWMATVDNTDTLLIWDWDRAEGEAARSALLSRDKNGLLAFDPSSTWLAAAGEGSPIVQLWSLADLDPASFTANPALPDESDVQPATVQLTRVSSEKPAMVRCLAFDPQGERLAVGHEDGRIVLWRILDPSAIPVKPEAPASSTEPEPPVGQGDTEQGTTTTTLNKYEALLEGHTGSIRTLVFERHKGAWLASASSDSTDVTLRTWDMQTEPPTPNEPLYGHDAPMHRIIHTARDAVLATGSNDGTIRTWNLNDNRDINDVSDGALVAEARHRAGRDFTLSEREHYMPGAEVQNGAFPMEEVQE